MKCNEIRELIPDLAAGLSSVTPEMRTHLDSCADCSGKLEELRQTMALLDEWQAPEPSAYFDVRLHARLREEAARQPASWLQWMRRPALATSLALLMVLGIALIQRGGRGNLNWFSTEQVASGPQLPEEPGTAVGDLEALDKNHELYTDFDVLDDLEVQSDVTANP